MLRVDDFAAIIFDMDGLVLDTESTYCIAWKQAAEKMGDSLTDIFCKSLSGLQKNEVESRLLAHCGADFDMDRFNELSGQLWLEHVHIHGINTRPGFTEFHEFISRHQIRYCLATNSHSRNAHQCLELAGIKNTFSHIITGDNVENCKPAPDIFFTAAKHLRVPIEWCLILEDSAPGIEAAVAAGAFSVFIPSTEPIDNKAAKQCDWLMTDLFVLLETFRESLKV